MRRLLRSLLVAVVTLPLGCESIARFDTKGGEAYCGELSGAQFIRTPEPDGFERLLRLRLEIDADALTTVPGTLTTDDAAGGPCAPRPTFDHARLRVTPELVHDTLSLMTFEDGQVQNLVAWADSTCRGPMLAVVSLYKDDHVDVRLLKPGAPPEAGAAAGRDAFARFTLTRHARGCGF